MRDFVVSIFPSPCAVDQLPFTQQTTSTDAIEKAHLFLPQFHFPPLEVHLQRQVVCIGFPLRLHLLLGRRPPQMPLRLRDQGRDHPDIGEGEGKLHRLYHPGQRLAAARNQFGPQSFGTPSTPGTP